MADSPDPALGARRLSLSTQAHRLAYVKAFTRFLYQDGYALIDAGAAVAAVRAPRRLPKVWLTEPEAMHLVESPTGDSLLVLRDRAMLEVLYGTAVRNNELCQLALDDVDLATDEVRVRYGKGGKSRLVPLGAQARYWLLRYLHEVRLYLVHSAAETALFLTCRGKPFDRQNVTAVVRRAAVAAGFDKRITPHVLRHACATHMLRRGAGLRHVQELLGHASPSTTQGYTRVDIADLHGVHERFHPRGRA